MNFLYPSFLWAIAFVAIPIIIHFFNFQKAKKVYFSNVTFLKEVNTTARSRSRLQHLLILIARCLFICALVLAFAQPYFQNNNAENIKATPFVSIYLDNSLSMQNEAANKNLLDKGIEFAEQISAVYPKNTRFQLLENAFEGSLHYFVDQKNFSEKLSKIAFSSNTRQLSQVYGRQKESFIKQASPSNNPIFWISDFQKGNFKDFDTFKPDSTCQLYLLKLDADQVGNFFVDSVWLENPHVKTDENNAVFAKIRYVGTENSPEKLIKLFVENRQESSSKVSIQANSSQIVKLNFAVNTAGAKACYLEIDDSPVIFDNRYFFTIKVSQSVKIKIISENRLAFLPKVYGNENFFEPETLDPNALDYNAFLQADLLVLEGVQIDQALKGALQNFLKEGKTLLIFPKENPEKTNFEELLGIKMEKTDSEKTALEIPEFQNPFFEGVFEKLTTQMNLPQAQNVWQWGTAGEQLLKLKSKQSFLGLFRGVLNENSKVYLFAAPLTETYSDFAKHALFVPVMYKIALSSLNRSERMAFSLDESNIEILLDSLQKNDIFKLVPIDQSQQAEIIVSQRIVGQKLLLELPKTLLSAGNYFLVHQQSQQKRGIISLNYAPQESVFEHFSTEELQKWAAQFPNVQVFESSQIQNFGKEFKEKNVLRNLWREMLILGLLFLLIEILLIRFWKN